MEADRLPVEVRVLDDGDDEPGEVVRAAQPPRERYAGSEGIPAMYEFNGRQYLVVPASSKINTGGGHDRPGTGTSAPATGGGGYVVFGLPGNPVSAMVTFAAVAIMGLKFIAVCR